VTPRNAFLLVLSIGLAWGLADQWTKYLAVRDLTHLFPEDAGLWERIRLFYGTHGLYPYAKPPVSIVPGVWNHVYVQNPAGAFGLLSGAGEGLRRVIFTGVAMAAAVGILWMAWRSHGPGMRTTQLALALVFGGAIGNLIDRIVHGYVIDFIDWYVTFGGGLAARLCDGAATCSKHWPAFNLADVGIVVGVFGLIFLLNRAPVEDPDAATEKKKGKGKAEQVRAG
jgi:signal peptidase II